MITYITYREQKNAGTSTTTITIIFATSTTTIATTTAITTIILSRMEKLVFDADPKSIGIIEEGEDGVGNYLPVLLFNFKITGWVADL